MRTITIEWEPEKHADPRTVEAKEKRLVQALLNNLDTIRTEADMIRVITATPASRFQVHHESWTNWQ